VGRPGRILLLSLALALAMPGVAGALVLEEFPLGGGSRPRHIVAGPDGAMWFTDYGGGHVGRITTAGEITLSDPVTGSPEDIVLGPDGAMWFAMRGANVIGRVATSGPPPYAVTEYSAGITAGSGPRGIAVGPDDALWFTEYDGDRIGRIDTNGNVTGEFPVPAGSGPRGIATGADDNLWFTANQSSQVVRMDTLGNFVEFPVSELSTPVVMVAGPDGNLWFTEHDGDRIGRVTPAGVVTEFAVAPGDRPDYIGVGPDGNLWFTGFDGHRLGRITTSGRIVEFGLPGDSQPLGVNGGPDGAIWFADAGRNSIWRAVREAPGADTGAASAVGQTTATLAGKVDPKAEPTTARFEYGPTTAYGASSAVVDARDGTEAIDVSASLGGLLPGTTYHYRLMATSPVGTTTGPDKTFTTPGFPPGAPGAPGGPGSTIFVPGGPTLINATIDPLFGKASKGRTTIKRMIVRGVPRGGAVDVRCTGKGKGCPKRFRVRKNGTVNLRSKLRRAKLRSGAKLEIRVIADGRIGKVFVYTMRRGRSPRLDLRCLPPGASRVVRCE